MNVLNCWFIYSHILNCYHKMLDNKPDNLHCVLRSQVDHYGSEDVLDQSSMLY